MVQSLSWEANWFAASQEIPRISRNPKVHYRTHKRPPPVSILGQPNPVHIGGVVYIRIVLSPEESSRMWVFLNINVLQGGVVSTSPNPQAEGPPLVGCPRLLIQFIRSYPPYRRPFLYPQPEDAPCRGKFIIFLYMFRALLAHHQEVKIVCKASGIITPVGGRPVHGLREDFSQPVHRTATYKCDDTGCCIYNFYILMMST